MISSKAKQPELHVPLDGLHHRARRRRRRWRSYFGEAPVEPEGLRADDGHGPLHEVPRRRDEAWWEDVYYWKTPTRTAATTAGRTARTTRNGRRPGRRSRASGRLSVGRDGRRDASRRLAVGRGGGSLASSTGTRARGSRCCSRPRSAGSSSSTSASLVVLFLSAFWQVETFTADIVRTCTLDNFRELWERPVYRDVAWRTIRMASPSRSPTRCSRSRSRTTWRGSPRRASRNCCSSRCCCRSGRATSSGSTRGG